MRFVIEAYPDVDMTNMSYFMIDFDLDFFEALQETITEIKIQDALTFGVDSMYLLNAPYHTIRRQFKIKDVESDKYTFNVQDFTITQRYMMTDTKVHLDNQTFYFTGKSGEITFSSLSFSRHNLNCFINDCKKINKQMVLSGS
jgi:UDP-N-acetylmuramyl pentapeptide synthase